MLDINQDRMNEVAQQAFDKTNSLRWQTAIAKAKREIESNPYMRSTGHSPLMLSESGGIYEADGVRQCRAFADGQPCYHRAAHKLVKRYMERSH